MSAIFPGARVRLNRGLNRRLNPESACVAWRTHQRGRERSGEHRAVAAAPEDVTVRAGLINPEPGAPGPVESVAHLDDRARRERHAAVVCGHGGICSRNFRRPNG